MSIQALYRRYRPGKFGEVIGQSHVVNALKNAVANERVGHAYLFSGPRGTGKTSLARILAKALNCEQPDGGEPCGECASCKDFAAGTAYDLYELDAASNNGVDAMRDLISMVALTAIRNYKIYVIDEVHMLSSGAENALLKTLEEPPGHVIFVMCTTEPHKVVETVRSRTQHLEFNLVSRQDLEKHLKWVIDDAGLSVADTDLEYVLNEGGGSVRDSLSALDQVVAAGKAPERQDIAGSLVTAILETDMKGALEAVANCFSGGMELRIMVGQAVEILRSAFLYSVGVEQENLSKESLQTAKHIAESTKLPRIVYVIESLGDCLAALRSSPNKRVELEVTLIKLTRSNQDEIRQDFKNLVELITKLEDNITKLDREIERKRQGVDAQSGGDVNQKHQTEEVEEAADAKVVESEPEPEIEPEPAPEATVQAKSNGITDEQVDHQVGEPIGIPPSGELSSADESDSNNLSSPEDVIEVSEPSSTPDRKTLGARMQKSDKNKAKTEPVTPKETKPEKAKPSKPPAKKADSKKTESKTKSGTKASTKAGTKSGQESATKAKSKSKDKSDTESETEPTVEEVAAEEAAAKDAVEDSAQSGLGL